MFDVMNGWICKDTCIHKEKNGIIIKCYIADDLETIVIRTWREFVIIQKMAEWN